MGFGSVVSARAELPTRVAAATPAESRKKSLLSVHMIVFSLSDSGCDFRAPCYLRPRDCQISETVCVNRRSMNGRINLPADAGSFGQLKQRNLRIPPWFRKGFAVYAIVDTLNQNWER